MIYGSSDDSYAGTRIPSNGIQHILFYFGSSIHSWYTLTMPITSQLSILTQNEKQFSLHRAVWCTFLWVHFCCLCISVHKPVNKMHICLLGVRKTNLYSSSGDDSPNDCATTGVFSPMLL
ncbi:hypothetical protein TNCV_205811 [Trichonephila clavipes]|nr:hypothetical protein TNCV_205811 [Trichonephila clavipes]